ncbi:hypothetical protein AXJ18_gp161 [Streptomyces phage Jay2Jay]|uniref:Uncharacterized protein n=1 Tax=Streptomyces phage Jay2Jay TaxID=1556290 RepID=A0A0A0RLA6_9CAUD|nr:hypothetical protein AXJ18_gp161 [Streptomyces phage Jay2Jay]AIW02613.1 hypothetical protein PBI_JAY2JAY_124 [Streptomyces phage Jay2Jay]
MKSRWKYSAKYKSPNGCKASITSSVRADSFDEAYEEVCNQLRHQSFELIGMTIEKE